MFFFEPRISLINTNLQLGVNEFGFNYIEFL
jgi:hypothetical protein